VRTAPFILCALISLGCGSSQSPQGGGSQGSANANANSPPVGTVRVSWESGASGAAPKTLGPGEEFTLKGRLVLTGGSPRVPAVMAEIAKQSKGKRVIFNSGGGDLTKVADGEYQFSFTIKSPKESGDFKVRLLVDGVAISEGEELAVNVQSSK